MRASGERHGVPVAGALGLAVAYLLGSIPTGYLAGTLLRGIDIREHGSKSTGATNVWRTLGTWPALAALLIDLLKGVAAIVFAGWFFEWLQTVPVVAPPIGVDAKSWVPWGRVPLRTRHASGAWPFDLAKLHRR